MAITEGNRHRMHQRLEDLMGDEDAATLMEHLPPVGWADVATKADLDHLRAATKADIDQLRTATKADIEQLRTATTADIDQLRTATTADIDQLRAAMDHLQTTTTAEFEHLHTVMALQFEKTATRVELGDLRTELHKVMRTHTLFIIGANIAVIGLVAGLFAR